MSYLHSKKHTRAMLIMWGLIAFGVLVQAAVSVARFAIAHL